MSTLLLYAPTASDLQEVQENLALRQEWELVTARDTASAVALLEKGTVDLLIIEAGAWQHPVEDLLSETAARLSLPAPILVLTAGCDPIAASPRSRDTHDGLVTSCPSHQLTETIEQCLDRCVGGRPRLKDVLKSTASSFAIEDNNLEVVSMVAKHLSRLSREFAVCRNGDCAKVAVALEEAMINGIIHGNLEVPSVLRDEEDEGLFHRVVRERRSQAPFCSRRLWVDCRFTMGSASFTVRDEGPGFDPAKILDPTLVENVDKAHGRGLFLIRTFMDSVSFNEQGNAIHLVKGAPPGAPPAALVDRN